MIFGMADAVKRDLARPGDYVYPLLDDEEAPLTWLERLVRWTFGKELMAAERAILLQEARRLRLKTDLCEKRIAARKARDDRETTVAIWRFSAQQTHTTTKAETGEVITEEFPVDIVVHIVRSKEQRRAYVSSIVEQKTGMVMEFRDKERLYGFVQSREAYTNYLLPWIEGSVSDDALRHLGDVSLVKDLK